jgi:hypothetical protein
VEGSAGQASAGWAQDVPACRPVTRASTRPRVGMYMMFSHLRRVSARLLTACGNYYAADGRIGDHVTLGGAADPAHVLRAPNPNIRHHKDPAESAVGASPRPGLPATFAFCCTRVDDGCGFLRPNRLLSAGIESRLITRIPRLVGGRILGRRLPPRSSHQACICLRRIDSPPCALLS